MLRFSLLFAAGLGTLVSSCAGGPAKLDDSVEYAQCVAGERCFVRGKLKLVQGVPVSTALVVSQGQCVKVALPNGFFESLSRQRWVDRQVTVGGEAFLEPAFDDADRVTFWYEERGRRVGLGSCDGGLVIYASVIEDSFGRREFR